MNDYVNVQCYRIRAAVCAAILLVTPTYATVTNVAWYRLGESDPGAASGQVAKTTTVDVLGVKTLTTADGTYFIAHNGNSAANGWGLLVGVTNVFGTTTTEYAGEFGGGVTVGSGGVRGGWAHVALVRDNGTSTFYLNGKPSGSTSAVTPATPTGAFAIAANPQALSGFFPGMIDGVRVFAFAAGQFRTNDLLLNQRRIAPQPATSTTTNSSMLPRGSPRALSALPEPDAYAARRRRPAAVVEQS